MSNHFQRQRQIQKYSTRFEHPYRSFDYSNVYIHVSRYMQSMRDDAVFIGKTWRLLLIESLFSILDRRPMTSV